MVARFSCCYSTAGGYDRSFFRAKWLRFAALYVIGGLVFREVFYCCFFGDFKRDVWVFCNGLC